MYIHIGSNRIINEKNIVAVFDLDTTGVSEMTRIFLRRAEENGMIAVCDDGLPKSAVLCDDGSVFLTRFSSRVLVKRNNLQVEK